jgi:hypothetical protein
MSLGVERHSISSPVHIEEVLIEGARAEITGDGVRVPPGSRRLDVRYTAIGLRPAARMTFRYRLEGHDRDWVDAGTNRTAQYTNLAPGKYTFRVTATNEAGVRSNKEARIVINVAPRWFETWWPGLLALALIGIAVFGVVQFRRRRARAV